MKAVIIQTNLFWEDKQANLSGIGSFLSKIGTDTDLVVLPEMFTTAFSMNPAAFAEPMNGPTVGWMLEKSSSGGYALCGTLIIEEEGKFYNRLLFVYPDGNICFYDKKHLHSMSGEHEVYTPGNKQVICSFMGFNIRLLVCYDLRFTVWSRNRNNNTDVIIYSANWPVARSYAWKSLLVARAIENQCYVIGVNRTGQNPDGTAYTGDSMIIGPKGDILGSLSPGTDGIISADLSFDMLSKYRADMPVWRDADQFTID